MDELLELIARIGGDDAPSSEELSAARDELVGHLRVATAKETRDLSAATAIRGAVDKIDSELTSRREQAEADEAEAARLLDGLAEPTDETETATDADAETESETATETASESRERVPVAASASLRTALTRTRARMSTEAPEGNSRTTAITLGAAQSERLGANPTLNDVARVFAVATDRVKTRGARQPLVRIETNFPAEHQLFGSERIDNDRLLNQALVSPQLAASAPATAGGVGAAGGICAPWQADLTHPILGSRQRPIRDALPRFQGGRGVGSTGAVRFSPTATIADMAGSVGVWTYETDVDPGVNEKSCLVLECEDELSATVDAVTACLQIGNFAARFSGDYWRSRLDLLMVAHDRLAEQTLYAQMRASASLRTYTGTGSIYSVLSAISKADAGIRSRLRLDNRARMNVILPFWVRNALRDDINRQRLGAAPADQYGNGVGDRVIDEFFRARNINPVYSLDLDTFSAPASGTAALLDYPGGDAELLVYPEGAYFMLDGGTLDLGTEIVDSTLIAQNNRMAFLETFEQAVFRGGEAIAVTVSIDEVCTPCADSV